MTQERDGDDLDREVADLEQSASKVQDNIEETRSDWEAKKDDPSVPGAVSDPDDRVADEASGAEGSDAEQVDGEDDGDADADAGDEDDGDADDEDAKDADAENAGTD